MNRSTFPEQIDSFTELYDLPASMVTQAKRYQELKMKPTLSSAEQDELNSLSALLQDFIITPEVFNKFADAVVSVETFFTEKIVDYIEEKQLDWAGYVSDFTYQGVYDATKAYNFQNMVTYDGDLYLCVQDSADDKGDPSTDPTYWQKISTKGDKGDIGLNLFYKGDYSATKTYAVGDAVTYTDGLIYFAKVATVAGQAPTDQTKWQLFERNIVSATQPAVHQQGTVWIKLQ
ncbi:hypothetical protein V7094_27550 [Priestia megaterium]|uniref:hypothetical protein n=1 Tax=Priestia megaterium TaxID=1404 RepID=UPI002FFF8D0F